MVLAEDILSEETFVAVGGKIFPNNPGFFINGDNWMRHNISIVAKSIPLDPGSCRQKYVENRSLPRYAIGSDRTSMVIYDLLAQGKPDPRSTVSILAVETLEDTEDLVCVLLLEPNTIVLEIQAYKPPAFRLQFHRQLFRRDLRYFHKYMRLSLAEFQGISDQVPEKLAELGGYSRDHRQYIQ